MWNIGLVKVINTNNFVIELGWILSSIMNRFLLCH